jgi:3'-phosphoadenosine 5'-phosphosulfate sulfotransferase (PAPS reductase)/FAD synthetase
MILNAERIITLNCGLGRDSLAMLALVLEHRLQVEGLGVVTPGDLDVVVFSDTGCEWLHTYQLIEKTRRLCAEHGVRFLTLYKGEGKHRPCSTWEDIERNAATGGYHLRPAVMADLESRETVVSMQKGDCTDNHKIACIRKLLSDIARVRWGIATNYAWGQLVKKGQRQPHLTMIGIAADEASRIKEPKRKPLYVTEAYPLVDMEIAKPDEAAVLERWGLGHVRKSGCWCCPYQPPSWYWALSIVAPEIYAAVVAYEEKAMARNANMYATGMKRTIPDGVARWRAKNPLATVDEVLDKNYSRVLAEARKQLKKEAA